jgi:phosphoglucosamine mutase
MITASHNPLDHNGIKLMAKGRELTPEEGNKIAAEYIAKKHHTSASKGLVQQDNSIVKEHMELVLKQVKPEKPLRVVVDCNGAASVITPYVLSALGCKVISINTSLEEFFRPSEPKEENLTTLAAAVRATGADLGIAHDADGDRCIVLDRTGEQIPMDIQLAMMIEEELAKSSNKKIAATVEASLLIRETVEQHGGKVTITPVGSTYLALEIENHGAYFAGEPCGEYIYSKGVLAPDGVLTAAKFVELASKQELSELKKKYKHYPIARERYPTADRQAAMKKITAEVIRSYSKFSSLDGIRVDEEDGWFLVRPSGTEKIIRLTMEYKDKAKLEKKKAEIEKIIQRSV